MLEGEKAQRSEVARRLADATRRAARERAEAGGGGERHGAAAALEQERAGLEAALQRHSAQVAPHPSGSCRSCACCV